VNSTNGRERVPTRNPPLKDQLHIRRERRVPCSTNRRSAYTILVKKHKEKRPPGGGRILEDNIKIDIQEIATEDVDWIDLSQDSYKWLTVLNMPMSLRVPWVAGIMEHPRGWGSEL
jgi:hypothetical protein